MIIFLFLFFYQSSSIDINKKFNEVCWLTSHNAFASKKYDWVYKQQNLSIEQQLDYGVRALMIDLWWHNNQIYLLHNDINLTRLQKWSRPDKFEWLLSIIKKWLNDHPAEIITLIIESHLGKLGGKEITRLLEKNSMENFMYKPPRKNLLHGKWDTLINMIHNNTRLVMISRNIYDKIIYDDNVVIENKWEFNKNPDGDKFFKSNGSIYIFNHFKTVSSFPYSNFNSLGNIMKRINNAYKIIKKYPNFISVDFVEIGDAKYVVSIINNITSFENLTVCKKN